MYFQCSGVDPDSGMVTTALCFMALPTKVGEQATWVNAAVEPMSYGFAGMKWRDKDEKSRIGAGTWADARAAITWFDKDEKERISAATLPDGAVQLPATDLKPKP